MEVYPVLTEYNSRSSSDKVLLASGAPHLTLPAKFLLSVSSTVILFRCMLGA